MAPQRALAWRKSSFSGDGGTGGGNCVEAAPVDADRFALRDSKNPTAAMLTLPRIAVGMLVRCITAS